MCPCNFGSIGLAFYINPYSNRRDVSQEIVNKI
jgi:hypothetical protein